MLAGGDLAPDLVLPGGDPVGPGAHRELPAAGTVDLERAGEAVVAERTQGFLAPAPLPGPAHTDRGAEGVVAVLEDRRVDADHVADRPLDRMAAAVEHRLDRLQLDPGRWLLGLREGHRA